jgi:hypothetical protein
MTAIAEQSAAMAGDEATIRFMPSATASP